MNATMKSKLILPGFTALSMLLVAYGPMATFASAQSATDAQVQSLKQKIESVLNQRIQSYKDTISNMGVNVQLAPDSSSAGVTSDNGGLLGTVTHTCKPDGTSTTSPSPSASPSTAPSAALTFKDGQLVGSVAMGCSVMSQAKQFMQGMVSSLTTLLGNVQKTNNLGDLQNLAKNADGQADLGSLFQMFGQGSQSINSLTGVLDNLKTTWNDMSTGVHQMKECAKGLFGNHGGTTSPSPSSSASASPSPSTSASASVDANGAQVDCGKFHISSSEIITQAENLLNAILPIIMQIGSMILSAVVQMLPMLLSMTSMLGMVGGMSSLTSGGGLGSMGGLQQMLPMLTMLPTMLLPMVSMISQLGLASGMGSNVTGSLGNLGSMIGL